MEKTLIPINPETIPEGTTKAAKVSDLTAEWQSSGNMAGSLISSGVLCLVSFVLCILLSLYDKLSLPAWLWVMSFAGMPVLFTGGIRHAKRSAAAKKAIDVIIGDDRRGLLEAAERVRGDVDGWNASLDKLREAVLALEPAHATPEGIRKVVELAEQLTSDRQKIVGRIETLKRRTELP